MKNYTVQEEGYTGLWFVLTYRKVLRAGIKFSEIYKTCSKLDQIPAEWVWLVHRTIVKRSAVRILVVLSLFSD